jgi:type IV pilus assembly protein PilQ
MIKKDGIYYINSTGTIATVVSSEKKARAISEHKVTRLVPINYVSASGLMAKVKSVLSSQGRVVYDKSLHSLLITDIPNRVARAIRLVKMLDKRTPEVEIIAKMVEVDKDYTNNLGITWGGNVTVPPAAGVASYGAPAFVNPSFAGPSFNGQASSSAGTFTVGILNHNGVNFNATINALESLSKAKSIASPKVVVLNNEPATIGKTISLSYILPATGVGGTSTMQSVTLPITLQITPHIMANGNVKLAINFSNTVAVAPPSVGIGVTPTTSTDQETINSTVIVNNGQTVVIGGVYQMSKTVTNSGIPGLMSIPLLGWLFKSQNINHTKDELLIFITPRIINS